MSPAGATIDVLRRFDVAPPALVEARALQQRVDRKFLLGFGNVEQLLEALHPGYLLLRAGKEAWARYDTLYFDTPDREFFHQHRRRRRPRYKVRIRHHVDRQLTFLEVKRKDGSGRTVKRRHSLPFGHGTLGLLERRFIEAHVPIDSARLAVSASISFLRLTLLGTTVHERLTLDGCLEFAVEGHVEGFPRLVIAEVKQPRHLNYAAAIGALRAMHAPEATLSKYCLAVIRLTRARPNVFKPALRAIERICS